MRVPFSEIAKARRLDAVCVLGEWDREGVGVVAAAFDIFEMPLNIHVKISSGHVVLGPESLCPPLKFIYWDPNPQR